MLPLCRRCWSRGALTDWNTEKFFRNHRGKGFREPQKLIQILQQPVPYLASRRLRGLKPPSAAAAWAPGCLTASSPGEEAPLRDVCS